MKVFLIIASMVFPLIMFFLQRSWANFRTVFNVMAVASAIIFGNIASLSIFEIIKDKTVFMTNIHAVFLNPFFLISGSYLAIYIFYRLIIITIEEK
ncbi:transposase [Virgibacillus necropolis]|uniref:transposase n=1 Tax=Virgibacillus necropolis TaxID=163877 RepID=UPI00384C4AEC